VLALCDQLRSYGLDAWIDQYEISPPEGWPRWCAAQVRGADFVLVVCTEIYERRFRGEEEPDRGLGVQWEGYVATQELYEAGARNSKFIPVIYPPASLEHIPDLLRGVTRYDVGSGEGLQLLYRHLTDQPATPAPPLGSLMTLPKRERRTNQFFVAPEPRPDDGEASNLSDSLKKARQRLKEQTINGVDTSLVRQEILLLKREIREGGRLKAGDFLAEGRFELLKSLGYGGFGTIWKAYDEKLSQLVAVKVLHGQHAEDRTRRERFFRGAREMAKMRHPGVVEIIEEHLEDDGYHFFVMEHVVGGDLRQAVLEGRLGENDIFPLILSVGETISFAHERSILHRDIKPANILLDDRGGSKLTDFDLVRTFDSTPLTQTQGAMGTFLFTAPEVMIDAKEASVASDVYSLAMTAAFAYYGKDLPLDVLIRQEEFFGKLVCAAEVKEALLRGASVDVEERTGSVAELCAEMRGGRPSQKRPRLAHRYSPDKFIVDLTESLPKLAAERLKHASGQERDKLVGKFASLLQGDSRVHKIVDEILTPYVEPTRVPKRRKNENTRVLFLTLNAEGRLPEDSTRTPRFRITQEAIRRAFLRASGRQFELIEASVVRARDLSWYLLEYDPDILHFSSDGYRGALLVEDQDDGTFWPLDGIHLSELFSIFRGRLRCVVLNSAYSGIQAELIAREVGSAVTFPEGVSGSVGLIFSEHFYEALAFGRTLREAFEMGCWQVKAQGEWGASIFPQLLGEDRDVRFMSE
jgi:serine/threonine protein kinase